MLLIVGTTCSAQILLSPDPHSFPGNGTTFGPEIVKPSAFGDTPDNLFFGGCARRGDYSDVELDPLDNAFWVTGMYMKLGGSLGELTGTWIRRAEVDLP